MILFLKLILAHLIGDFFLQSDSWIADKEKRKWKSGKLLLHVLVHTLLVFLVVVSESLTELWWIIPVIAISHWAIDALKLGFQGKNAKRRIRWFLADQAAHILVIIVVWLIAQGNPGQLKFIHSKTFWLSVTSIVLLSQPTAMIVKAVISRWTPEEDGRNLSLADAGKFIGMLERFFVLGFVITGNWEGIGFLLAAKSVFRFGDLNKAKDRNLTEYVLIGTLLSFGIAILVGIGFKYMAAF